MNVTLILALLLVSVLATDATVALLFFTIRSQVRDASTSAADATLVTAELASLVTQIRARAEWASMEIERQRDELRHVAVISLPSAAPAPARTSPASSLRLTAGQRTSDYAEARAAGISAEEVRLRQAMQQRTSA